MYTQSVCQVVFIHCAFPKKRKPHKAPVDQEIAPYPGKTLHLTASNIHTVISLECEYGDGEVREAIKNRRSFVDICRVAVREFQACFAIVIVKQ
ncbi:hypothetical protein G6F70_000852 [Rhizopus microsporus]|uniref:Uncharacterized protein n=1 Tax=Rhizopus azygosporus TaxID=86630 RepID=A0A367JV66_RHIAZ|nr:hypothetical protein G6F71_000568 [Rhizopus microsporus]RCH93749.1 hypothetical protein CU097_005100 [Rhizopus azygosporus]KAG1204019.1 hypothetical protein G6F70_000852 [Rhizopus microsporus]KAG1214971.1 hypothetical protein G6F69_001437 [Rhizopus microsporus]KAG1237408.1 hypothetical protein G6F67_001237 [Rhizopus microsporus]